MLNAAQHLRRRPGLTRSLLAVLLLVSALIVGLLAMHTLNTHPSMTGHGATVTLAAGAVDHHPSPSLVADDQRSSEPAVGTSECADCAEHHGMAWMSCILALLVAAALVSPRRKRWRMPFAHLARQLAPDRVRAIGAYVPPPPSLHSLCVSRT